MNPALAFLGIGILVGGLIYLVFGRKMQAANNKASMKWFGSNDVEYSKSSARYAAPVLLSAGVVLIVVSFLVG